MLESDIKCEWPFICRRMLLLVAVKAQGYERDPVLGEYGEIWAAIAVDNSYSPPPLKVLIANYYSISFEAIEDIQVLLCVLAGG